MAFDATFLLYLFAPAGDVGAPKDENDIPVDFVKERAEALVDDLGKAQSKILIPTPALSEIMVRAGVEAGVGYISLIRKSAVFQVAPFDEKAAIETAILAGEARKCPSLRVASDGTYAKIKYDRQIVAIAVSEGAAMLYTDDKNQRAFALRHGLKAVGIGDCPVPASVAQMPLDLTGKHHDSK